MTRTSPRFEWLPPLLIGVSAAVMAEVSLSVLLYGGLGFVRSLTTILAVQGLAFAAGLWSSPSPGDDLVDRVRHRWLFCLLAFVAAAVFGTMWSVFPGLSEDGLGQGAGLAFLAALPLYATGTVLGGMSVLAGTDPGQRLAAPGAAAAAGAALGFVVTGLALPRVPLPASLVVVCLVLLSFGGMVYGGVLASRTEIRSLGRRPGRGPHVTVEERRMQASSVAVKELREGPFVRRTEPIDSPSKVAHPWEVAVLHALLPKLRTGDPRASAADEDAVGHGPARLLIVGGGASSLPRAVEEEEGVAVDVLERTAAVVELGREHFETGLDVGRNGRRSVVVGNLDDAIIACDGDYDLVLIDVSALKPIGGVAGLSAMSRRRLPALLSPGGILGWGPAGDALVAPDVASGWQIRAFRRGAEGDDEDGSETVVLVRRGVGDAWDPALEGFTVVSAP
ncbi:MAG: hypothetical protein R3304_01435 [Longimicrobiales bacterium]|nr:hypothetical protein [Longimicrobiales bacterium]